MMGDALCRCLPFRGSEVRIGTKGKQLTPMRNPLDLMETIPPLIHWQSPKLTISRIATAFLVSSTNFGNKTVLTGGTSASL